MKLNLKKNICGPDAQKGDDLTHKDTCQLPNGVLFYI